MGRSPKYTVRQVLDKCKNVHNRTEFNACGLKIVAVRLNILAKCLSIIDKNNYTKKTNERKEYIKYAEKCMSECKSITEFRTKYPQFKWFINKNLKKYKHKFIKQKFSTQQLVCKKILETILSERCLYNCRTLLNNRKEIDIYFERFKLACEYDSYFWHTNTRCITEDKKKKTQCKKLGICLINIKEPSLNFYNSFETSLQNIKQQFKDKITIINNATGKQITQADIDGVHVDYIELLKECYNLNDIEYIINHCKTYAEVRLKYNKIWQYLHKNKMLGVLDPVKKRDHRHMSKEDYFEYIKKECPNYTLFLKHKTHSFARRRGFTKELKELLPSAKGFRSFAQTKI